MEFNEKKQALYEIDEEINVILAIKKDFSNEEIKSFTDVFPILTEKEIRERIVALTGDESYLAGYEEIKEITMKAKDEMKKEDEVERQEIAKTISEDIVVEENRIEESKKIVEEDRIEESKKIVEEERIKESKKIVKENRIEQSENINKQEVIEATKIEEIIEQKDEAKNLETIGVIREDIKYNQLSIGWDWKNGIDKVLVAYRCDKYPTNAKDSNAIMSVVDRQRGESKGEFIVHSLKYENYYFCIFPIVIEAGETKYLECRKRLVVNKVAEDIYYEVKIKKPIFRAEKALKIILKTDKQEVNLPPVVLIVKKGDVPLHKSDGNLVYKFFYTKVSKNKPAELEIPLDIVGENNYIKLFMEDDKTSSLYRLIPPKKEQLYIKREG